MSLLTLRKELKGEIFDYQLLLSHLKEVKAPRTKIGRLLKKGDIIRIKKGLYVFGEPWRKSSISLEIAANLVYGPSCISFEYALFRYGMLSERATVVTSLTCGKPKEFKTPIGIFRYHAISMEKFAVGIEYREIPNEGGYFIASREKALADLVYRIRKILSIEELKFYLFVEMRISEEIFRSLNRDHLKEIADIYKSKNVENLLQI